MYPELDRMLSLGVIEPSESPWSNPLIMVKKANGKPRLCLDSRKLNAVTKKDAFPLPHISRILGRLNGTKFLSAIDLSDGFWQVALTDSAKEKNSTEHVCLLKEVARRLKKAGLTISHAKSKFCLKSLKYLGYI